ncbi:3651_t:CDS:2, partial [Racocetra persica]
TVNTHTNLDNIDSDSDSEIIKDGFEVETTEGYSIIFSKKLDNTIKKLKNEIKSNKHKTSIIVAEAAGKGIYHACCICLWTTNYIKNGSFLQSNKWNVNLNKLAKHVNEEILPSLCFDSSPTIYIQTVHKWLKTFGFEYLEIRKGMYMNGHEHMDVVAYCERFLERMVLYKMQIIVFSSENMEEETRPAFNNV